ncbi:MAG TPA: lytic murein transglycosylase [Caulobacteraceae bacterium]|jgi:lytic murein transglycosylase|nr:lytic murein transglycosylase [Caulobacteraceae bacterium]
MDRRLFLLMALAGTASPPAEPDRLGAPPLAVEPPGPATSGDPAFDQWARDFVDRAIRDGWPAEVLRREFTGLRPEPGVLALDARQPEFSKPVGDYIKGAVNAERVATGRRKRAELTWLTRVESRFGVPAEILIAIWAMESGFGQIQGDFDVLRVLATLAAAGRRRDWAETEILAVVRIIATRQATRAQLRGSWAGAMGQTQFEPSAYLADAVSLDGAGPPDIWTSSKDALASAANLLAKAGWVPGVRAQREVILPAGFDYAMTEGPQPTAAAWAWLGVQPADGRGWAGAEEDAAMMLILPSGAGGPAFLVSPNHFVIKTYNNSTAYALAVGLLADQIAGAPPLRIPWPVEVALSSADRISAQQDLAQLGFDPGAADGVVGAKTRHALQAWQKARGLVADGYLSPEMVRKLKAETSGIGGPSAD